MKKNKKQLISVVVAAVLISAMMGALLWQRSRPVEEVVARNPWDDLVQIVQRSEAELVSVTFQTQYDTHVMLPFFDENDRREWMWEGVDFILDNAEARNKIRGAFVLFAVEVIHEDIEEAGVNLADFGLDPPYMTVTALYVDGTTTTIRIGSPTIDMYDRFAMVDGDMRLHTISRTNANRFMIGLEDLVHFRIPTWCIERAEALLYVLIARRDGEVIEFEREELDAHGLGWLIMESPIHDRRVFESAFYVTVLTYLNDLVLAMVNLHPTNFADYGLDNPSLEFIYRSIFDETHLLFGDVFLREVNGNEVAYIYVKFADRPHVFEAPFEPVSSLFDVNPLRFIDRTFALVNIWDAEGLEVTSPRGDFDIRLNHVYGSNNDIEPTINGNPVEDRTFRIIYRLAIGLAIDVEIEPFTPTGAPLYTLIYNIIDGDDLEIRFFHYNDTFLAVSVDGEDIWFVTNRRNFNMFIDRLVEFG